MAIKPGLARKPTNKNPPFFSHEFVIQNHADIVSCVAMVFVAGLMLPATASTATVFVGLHHNTTGADPSQEHPRGLPYAYESGWKDWCSVFFYTLICIIMHALLQEYFVDKVSKRLHLSKFKLARFNDSCQLLVFHLISLAWGFDVIAREGYIGQISLLWDKFPVHPMIFLHKLYFIIQLAYYFHILPELYFQKVKKEDQQPKIIYSICSFSFIALAYFLSFQRVALVLLTLHYFSEVVSHILQLVSIFDRDDKFANLHLVNKGVFLVTRFATLVLSVLTLYYGIEDSTKSRAALAAVFALQGYLVFQFINDILRAKRERAEEKKSSKKRVVKGDKPKRREENDLPEADQHTTKEVKKVK